MLAPRYHATAISDTETEENAFLCGTGSHCCRSRRRPSEEETEEGEDAGYRENRNRPRPPRTWTTSGIFQAPSNRTESDEPTHGSISDSELVGTFHVCHVIDPH